MQVQQKGLGCTGTMRLFEDSQQFAEVGNFDWFLLAGPYTLLEQESLNSFLPLCERRGVRIILGGPCNSGAVGPSRHHGPECGGLLSARNCRVWLGRMR